MKEQQMMKPEGDRFYHGYAVALANVLRLHMDDIVVRDVMRGDGVSVQDLKEHGCDPYDVKEIEKWMKGLRYD